MQPLKTIGLLVLAGILGIIALVLFNMTPHLGQMGIAPVITNFDECVAAGNPVMESYPRQCRSADGRIFAEELAVVSTSSVVSETHSNGCAVAGCSGQLCVSASDAEGMVTTCEYRAIYGCYKTATCEPQQNGECGWTQTEELKQCLADPEETAEPQPL